MDVLKQTYYNPKEGLISLDKLYQKVKDKGISRDQVRKFIKSQAVAQIHKPINKKRDYIPITSPAPNNIYQADLIDLKKLSHFNSGYKYILTIIDIFSRRATAIPLKDKKDKSLVNAFKKMLDDFGTPNNLTTDNGSEFINKLVKELLMKEEVKQHFTFPEDHNILGVVERFNRTLKTMISKYMTAYDTKKYIPILNDLIYNYNHTIHRTLGIPPIDVKEDFVNLKAEAIKEKAIHEFRELQIGDYVRRKINKKVFDKGYTPNFSKEIYRIVNINGYSFSIENTKGVILKKPYKVYELEKVEGHLPTEIPKKRMVPEVVINPPKRGKIIIEKRKGIAVEILKRLKKN